MNIDPKMIKDMVREIVTTREDEMECPECFEHLDHFADLLLSGADLDNMMLRLRHHLEHCPHCKEEFDVLLDAVRNLQ